MASATKKHALAALEFLNPLVFVAPSELTQSEHERLLCAGFGIYRMSEIETLRQRLGEARSMAQLIVKLAEGGTLNLSDPLTAKAVQSSRDVLAVRGDR